jgi:hypothetical protein
MQASALMNLNSTLSSHFTASVVFGSRRITCCGAQQEYIEMRSSTSSDTHETIDAFARCYYRQLNLYAPGENFPPHASLSNSACSIEASRTCACRYTTSAYKMLGVKAWDMETTTLGVLGDVNPARGLMPFSIREVVGCE